MGRFKVYPHDESALTLDDGHGVPTTIYQARLRTWGRIEPEYSLRQMIVDTGCSLSLFTKQSWVRFQRHIQWIQFAPMHFPHRGHSKSLAKLPKANVLGGTFPYRLGTLDLAVTDLERTTFSTNITVLAKFLEDDRLPSYQVLGMRDGILQRLRLISEPATTETGIRAWLEEVDRT